MSAVVICQVWQIRDTKLIIDYNEYLEIIIMIKGSGGGGDLLQSYFEVPQINGRHA